MNGDDEGSVRWMKEVKVSWSLEMVAEERWTVDATV